MQNVVSKENPALRSVAELRKLYEEAGALHGRTVVAYCRTDKRDADDAERHDEDAVAKPANRRLKTQQ